MPETVAAIIRNRQVVLKRPFPNEELRDFWSFRPSGYRFMPKYASGLWDGYIRLLRRGKLPLGLFMATYEQAERDFDIRFCIEWDDSDPIEFRHVSTSDREYQVECVQAMKDASGAGGGIIWAATGVGKTRMAAMFCQDALCKICFVVDELTLMDQAIKAIGDVTGERIGQIGDTVFDPARVTVTMIQSLDKHRNRKEFREWSESVSAAIIDEMHTAINDRQVRVLDEMRNLKAIYGLTATLNMDDDGARLQGFALAGPVIYRINLQDATKQRYLTRGSVIQIGYTALRPAVPAKDYWSEYRSEISDNPYRNALIEDVVRAALAMDRAVVVLVTRVDHLAELQRRLQDVPLAIVKGDVKGDDRIAARDRFEAGEYNLILTNRVFAKGVDIKRVDLIVDATAGKSEQECVQRFGRGVRLYGSKRALVHVDVGDRRGRFGRNADRRYAAYSKAGIPAFRLEWRVGMRMDKVLQRAAELAEAAPEETTDERRGD